MTRVGVGLALVISTLSAGLAEAHPGRLDAQGCHWTTHPYVASDGTRIPEHDYHCHRPLGTLKLDTRERLPDPPGRGRDEALTQTEREGQ